MRFHGFRKKSGKTQMNEKLYSIPITVKWKIPIVIRISVLQLIHLI